MNIADKVKSFFKTMEAVWEAVPGYVKVFIYSVASSAIGLWIAGQLDWKAVVIILFTNLGLYTGPKAVSGVNKMLE
jgi:uncharacterized membrane protein YfcA